MLCLKKGVLFTAVFFLFLQLTHSYTMEEEEKWALITEASRGIGKTLSEKLLEKGWNVIGVARSEEQLDEIKKRYAKFHSVKADLTQNHDIDKFGKSIVNITSKLNIMVHNAGVKGPLKPLKGTSLESIDETISTNLLAPMKIHDSLSFMIPNSGRIMFVTSKAAEGLKEASSYSVSKAGLNIFVQTLRQELFNRKEPAVACVIPEEGDAQMQEKVRIIDPEVSAEFLAWFVIESNYHTFATSKIPTSIYDDWHHRFWLKDKSKLPPNPF